MINNDSTGYDIHYMEYSHDSVFEDGGATTTTFMNFKSTDTKNTIAGTKYDKFEFYG